MPMSKLTLATVDVDSIEYSDAVLLNNWESMSVIVLRRLLGEEYRLESSVVTVTDNRPPVAMSRGVPKYPSIATEIVRMNYTLVTVEVVSPSPEIANDIDPAALVVVVTVIGEPEVRP